MVTEDDGILEGEPAQIAEWRLERFTGLGFNDNQADLLAHGDIDWHTAAALIAADCPPDTAFLILT